MKTKYLFPILSNIIFLFANISFAQQLIHYEKFDADWTNNASIHSPAPTLRFWESNVGAADSRAWHRNDYTANWIDPTQGSPIASGANLTPQYARFHSRGINNNIAYLFTPILDMTPHQNEEVFLSFYFIDPDGENDDYVNLLFSVNGGVSYTTITTLPTVTVWTKYTQLIPRKFLTSQFRVAFLGVKNGNVNTNDMGIDEMEIYKNISVVTSESLPICSGSSTDLTAASLGAGTTYSWSPSLGLSSTTAQTVTASPATTTTYTVTATREGFSHSTSFTVGVIPLPDMTATEFPTGSNDCNLEYFILNANIPPTNTPFEETFGGSPSWTISGLLDYIRGAISTSAYSGGTAPEALMYWYNGFNIFSDWYMYPNDGNVNNYLPISLENFSSATLDFRHYFDFYAGNYDRNLSVEVSTDLTNWNTVWSLRNIQGDISATLVSGIDLNNYVNTTIYLRFRYSGDSYGMDNWYFDNIKITGTHPNYTFSPNTGLYTDSGLTMLYTGGIINTVYAVPDGVVSYTLHSSVGTCNQNDTQNLTGNSSRYFANNGNWNEPANWRPEVVPDISKCVKIPDNKTVWVNIDNAEAKSLDISQNGKLEIVSDRALTVQNEITIVNNVAKDNLVVESDASLRQINPAENIGEITVRRTATVPFNQYNFWASPVAGQNMYDIYPNIPPNRVMTYNTWDDYYTIVIDPTNGQFGIGYSIKGPSIGGPGVTSEFIGIPHNETLSGPNSIPINSADGQGFNLIGNPYPSNLNLKALYEYGTNDDKLDPSFYFWDNTGNTIMNQQGSSYSGINFAVYNAVSSMGTHAASNGGSGKIPNGIVKPGQGFLIQAINGNSIDINNSMRTIDTKINPDDAEAPYYKNGLSNEISQEGKFWLELITPDNLYIQIALGYFMPADHRFDQYDTGAVNENASDNFYSYSNDGVKLTINGRGPFMMEDVIPLGITVFENGRYKIKLEDSHGIFKTHQTVYLKDKYLRIVHNLTASDYEFKSRSGSYTDRFEIIYVPNQTTSGPMDNHITVIRLGNEVLVSSSVDKIARVEVFNLSGRGVYQNSDVGDYELRIPATSFGKEILIITVLTETGETFSQKLILN